MKEIMEKLNKDEEKKVSGGVALITDGNIFKGVDGNDFSVCCDVCGDEITGRAGVIVDSKGNTYCLHCANEKIDLLRKMGVKENFSTQDGLKYYFEN